MLKNKDIMLFLNSIRESNSKIAEIYETKRGNIQMEAYGHANVWRAFLEGRGMPVLEVSQDTMDGDAYVIIVFDYSEPDKGNQRVFTDAESQEMYDLLRDVGFALDHGSIYESGVGRDKITNLLSRLDHQKEDKS